MITGKDDYRDDLASRTKEAEKKGKKTAFKQEKLHNNHSVKKNETVHREVDDALHLAKTLNNEESDSSDPMAFSEESDDDNSFDESNSEVNTTSKYR